MGSFKGPYKGSIKGCEGLEFPKIRGTLFGVPLKGSLKGSIRVLERV